MNKIQQASSLLIAPSGFLVRFMPHSERAALLTAMAGEEGESIAENVLRVKEVIDTMPQTYETDGQGDEAVAHLHYFGGSVDAYVTEKDMGDGSDDAGQYQAFGKVNLGYGAELGYISIAELIENGIELDLYFEPKKLKEI